MIIYEDLHLMPALLKAHGSIMGITFLIVLPLGAWSVRLVRSKNGVWLHVAVQLLGWAMMLAGLALGTRAGTIVDILHKNTHTILGTVVVVCLIIQPFIGLGHHIRYRKTQQHGIWTLIHRWYGRALILLGMINGGLGLRLAQSNNSASTAGTIAYSVIAGVSGCAFLGLIIWSEMQNRTVRNGRKTSSQTMPNGGENEDKTAA